MKLLFLNAYFNPETIAFTHIEQDIIDELVRVGHEISIICPVPTRNVTDEIKRKYKKIKKQQLCDGKVDVVRFWAPQEKGNAIVRAFRYFWCNIREYIIARREKNAEAVFAVSTPPTQGMLCALVKKKLKKPFVYNLQDIFPDSLVTTGLTKEGPFLWRIGRKIENYTYKKADKIIVISETFKKNIMAKGVPEDKIEVVPNWIDTENVKPINKDENKLYDEYGIDKNKFIVVYAGNFGAAQGAEVVLEAAEALKDNENIHFVIFGGGAKFEDAKKFVLDNTLSNVTIDGLLPKERIAEVYSLGDVCLITCKKGVGNSGMPSKTWSIMACNTPIIASFDTDSELADIIRQSDSGICVEPENAEMLKEAIIIAMQEKRECNAREFVEKYASKGVCVPKYVKILEDVVSKGNI